MNTALVSSNLPTAGLVQLRTTGRAPYVAESAAFEMINAAAARHQARLNRLAQTANAAIANKCSTQSSPKVRKLIRRILASREGKLSALIRTIYCDPESKRTLQELNDALAMLNPFASSGEGVVVKLEKKGTFDTLGNSTGGFRVVCSFGWKRRALQELCADVLKACLPSHPFDYMEKGRGGADAAAVQLATIIKEGNYDLVVTADIKNCFGALKKEEVVKLLPLPVAVAENVLILHDGTKTTVELNAIERETINSGDPTLLHQLTHYVDTAARLGVPQGSLASSVILSRAVLGPILATTSFAPRVVLHGDDMAIPAKNTEEAESVLQALRSSLASSGATEPLFIKERISDVGNHVDFCKYKLKRFDGEIRFSPSNHSLRRFDENVERIYSEAPEGQEEAHVAEYVAKWKKAFPLWHLNEIAESGIVVGTQLAMQKAWARKSAK